MLDEELDRGRKKESESGERGCGGGVGDGSDCRQWWVVNLGGLSAAG